MRRLAVVIAAVTVLTAVPGAVAAFALQSNGQSDLLAGILFGALATGSAVTGSMVATRARGNAVGWILLAQGLGMSLTLVLGVVAAWPERSGGTTSSGAVAGWGADLLGAVIVAAPTGVLLLVFPTGHLQSRAWAAFAWFFVLVVVVSATANLLLRATVGPGIANPFLVHGHAGEAVHEVGVVAGVAAGPAAIGCLLSLLIRLRRSHGAEQRRIKWIVYSAGLAVAGFGLSIVLPAPAGDLAWALALLSVVLLPVSMGVAILRHRLFDIDVVVKRTLVYAILTVTLLTTYLLLVLALQLLLRPVAGDSDLAVAGSTLVVAALFGPLRRRVQQAVDRRFFRSQYDAARTLEAFAEHLRDEVDLPTLGSDLQLVVAEAMQPEHVSLWLREEAVTIPGRPRDTKVVP